METGGVPHVKPNDPLSADAQNLLIDAANRGIGGEGIFDSPFGASFVSPAIDDFFFLIKNSSGADVPRNGILGINGPLSPYTPSESVSLFLVPRQVVLDGVTPVNPTHLGRWVVMAYDTPAGTTGHVVSDPVVRVRVYVNGVADGYCDVDAGHADGAYTCYLGTGASGAQILWRENAGSGAGTVVWAIVRLGKVMSPIPFMLKTSLTPGGTADAYPTDSAGEILDEAWTITVTDTVGDKRARGKDDTGTTGAKGLAETLGDGTAAIVEIQQQAKMIYCQAKISSGNTLSLVDHVSAMDGGMTPVNADTDELTMTYSGTWETNNDAWGIAAWDETADVWRPLDFPCKT